MESNSIKIEDLLVFFTLYNAHPCLAGPLLCRSNAPSGSAHLCQFPLPGESNLTAPLQTGSKYTCQRHLGKEKRPATKSLPGILTFQGLFFFKMCSSEKEKPAVLTHLRTLGTGTQKAIHFFFCLYPGSRHSFFLI